jgi:hypothetical protein
VLTSAKLSKITIKKASFESGNRSENRSRHFSGFDPSETEGSSQKFFSVLEGSKSLSKRVVFQIEFLFKPKILFDLFLSFLKFFWQERCRADQKPRHLCKKKDRFEEMLLYSFVGFGNRARPSNPLFLLPRKSRVSNFLFRSRICDLRGFGSSNILSSSDRWRGELVRRSDFSSEMDGKRWTKRSVVFEKEASSLFSASNERRLMFLNFF